ncbi:MAG TPA: hypothetical protein PKW55_01155 [Spirochaetota bacterium]|nr:hypothetical protein [Spirochaetota bacterium]HOM38937.1 hypothetical protein [Spirochaetota bacterium]HPQ49195.1 hypothetical protein [Spirochaetota bacterium]
MISNFFDYIEPSEMPYNNIARRLGYPDIKYIETKEYKIIESLINELRKVWHPKAAIKTTTVKSINIDKLITQENIEIVSEKAIKILNNSKLLSFAAATLGKEAFNLLKDKKNSLTEYFFLDAIESEIIEQIIEDINKMIISYANIQGYNTTQRISPGYIDIPLSFQKQFLEFIDTEKRLGIKINEKYIMDPEKSITCIIGWIKK